MGLGDVRYRSQITGCDTQIEITFQNLAEVREDENLIL